MSSLKCHWLAALVALSVLTPQSAWAQSEIPQGLMKQNAATSGKTDVAKEGFEAPETPPAEPTDAADAAISAGGLFTAGNARSVSITSGGQFKVRRGKNQISATGAGNLGRASTGGDTAMEDTVKNLQGRLRYDRFLAEGVAVFLGVSARHDPFQGLDLRLNIDPGVAYYFIDVENHQLWIEAGYDLQHDVRDSDKILEVFLTDGTVIEKTETRHSARLFGGYENKLNAAVTLHTGLEYIKSLTDSRNWRLNYDVGLTSAIVGSLAAATTFSLRYDNNPLPTVKEVDAITAVSLVLTLL